ncbi:MAG: SIS domain-containing protein [Phycisphaerales bacterium]|nr:SIS domain-containing protein [Phycisphaerales bacterium]
MAEMAPSIATAALAVRRTLAAGGRVFTCGNGGSAAQAMHLAEELIGRYRADRPPLAALCLNADPTALTCIANDFGYEQVFARQVEALARPGDVLVALTTSGNSPNVLAALRAAAARGVERIGLLGKDGGAARALCGLPLVVPHAATEVVQEAHTVLIHLILEAVESPG